MDNIGITRNEENRNKNCYEEERIESEHEGFLDRSCGVTYIIHLENNGRYERIRDQMKMFPTTNIMIILHNKGYKDKHKNKHKYKHKDNYCQKDERITTPFQDLMDAFFTIFKHAQQNFPDQNILILEDDFQFISQRYHSELIKKEVNEFINQHKEERMIYSLGLVPMISSVSLFGSDSHRCSYFKLATHSIIYTPVTIKYLLSNYFPQNEKLFLNLPMMYQDWDLFLEKERRITKFYYHVPICIQRIYLTENASSHEQKFQNYFLKKLIQLNVFLFMNMHQHITDDKDLEKSWDDIYCLSYRINWSLRILALILFIILFITIVFILFRKFKKRK
jgi:hypothetical protein